MKRFLKKRWHSIPVSILSAVLALVLVAGGALAWYQVTDGTAKVTVVEAISYTVTGGDGSWDGDNSTWTVSIMAGETKILYLTVSNASEAELEVIATVDPISDNGLTVTGNDGIPLAESVFIPANSSGPFSIEVHADGDVEIQTDAVFTFELHRQ